MKGFLRGFGIALLAGGVLLGAFLFFPTEFVAERSAKLIGLGADSNASLPREKTVEERVAEARGKSARIRGLYMTADVANDPGAGATRLREHIIKLAEESEINGIVIDAKEVCGPDYDEKRLRSLLRELKQKDIWTIARITVFKDASQIEAHPEWYLTRKSAKAVGGECGRKRHLVAKAAPQTEFLLAETRFGAPEIRRPILWQDKRGGYWLDPASQGARDYILDISKRVIDLGFDELQFDYIRFPSDGDVEQAIYPSWDRATPRYAVLKSFFEFLRDNLKAHKPEIILSADLFGYVAAQREDLTIGQRLDDIGDAFDYVSFMAYPSHYYSGLYAAADPRRNLPEVNYTLAEARANPDAVVERSLLFARDYLENINNLPGADIVSTSSPAAADIATSARDDARNRTSTPAARLRPWLEDFFHEEDKAAGRPYGAKKVRMQIDAAERVEDSGWLLWNASNVYTDEALKKEAE